MTDNPSISARTIEALTAIATGLHDIADAVRETGQYDDRIPVFEDEYDDARQAVAHWLDRNYGPSLGHAVHDWLAAADDVLEVARTNMPQSVTETGPGATQTDSAGRGASGGLGERLRAIAAEPDPEESQYESVDVAALVGLADEAHRLEVHARVVEQSLRTARQEGDGARIKGEQWKARYEEARDANRRVLQVAQWFRGQGQTGYARKVEEAVGGMEGALNADHPLGKVIGVIREFGTEHYKTEEAPAGSPFRMPEDRAPVADRPLGRTAGELFGPSGVTLPALEASRITFAPELQAELNEQIDQWGKRLAARIRAEMGLAPNEEGS